jgi:hypothetical protein
MNLFDALPTPWGTQMWVPNRKQWKSNDALLSSLLDPLEGLGMLSCGKLELGAAPDFQH